MKKIWQQDEAVTLKNIIRPAQDIIMVSGFFDPLHGGHIDNIQDAAKYCGDHTHYQLVVVVNGDKAAVRKKGYVLLPIEHRMKVVAAIEGVDYVITFDTDTVVEALRILKPAWFFKGGDRNMDNINVDEKIVCDEIKCNIAIGINSIEKTGSSSNFFYNAIQQIKPNLMR